jgi:hypothetical protein
MMNAQERQLVEELFDRLSKLESAPRDGDAEAAIARGLKTAPNATYALVQTVLLQDEALRQAQARIQEWEDWYASTQQEQQAQQPQQQGGFLDSMRGALFGNSQGGGSVPRVQPGEQQQRPTWNTGQVLDQQRGPQAQNYAQQGYAPQQGYAQQQPQQGGGMFGGGAGGGGSFLGTAAAAAAGMIGGSILMNSLRGMTGGSSHQSFADGGGLGGGRTPWGGDQSNGSLARDAGLNDIGSSRSDGERQGLFDRASYEDQSEDDGDEDDDFDGDSDVA